MKKSLFFCALFLSTAAAAQPPSGASANDAGAGAGAGAPDPNTMICRNQRETGSMLSRTRVCKTRAQWEAERRDNRQAIDRSQANRTTHGN
jgi:hypothetical protein